MFKLKLGGRNLGYNVSPDVSSPRQQSGRNGTVWIHRKGLLSPGLSRPGWPSNADTHQTSLRRHTITIIKASPTGDPLLGSDGRSPLVS